MIFYVFLLVLLVMLSFYYEINQRKIGKYFVFIFIIFILGFSYRMGTDWMSYQDFYENTVPNINFKEILNYRRNFELGFKLINYLGYKLGLSYEMFMDITLSICIWILLNEMYKRTENYCLSFLFFISNYLLINSLEPVIRQLIAVTIIVAGFKHVEKQNFYKYLIYVILAAQFHSSAYICLVLYFCTKIKLRLWYVIFGIVITYVIIIFLNPLLNILSSIVPGLHRFTSYFYHDYYGLMHQRGIMGNIYAILCLIIFLLIIFSVYEEQNKLKPVANIAILYVIINYFQYMVLILYRLNQYFIFFMAVIIGYVGKIKYTGNKTITYKGRTIGYIYISIIYLIIVINLKGHLFKTELNRIRYLEYKNYFIEKIKGNVRNNLEEKKEGYKEKIRNLLEERESNK